MKPAFTGVLLPVIRCISVSSSVIRIVIYYNRTVKEKFISLRISDCLYCRRRLGGNIVSYTDNARYFTHNMLSHLFKDIKG
jgi:hypothetical protein